MAGQSVEYAGVPFFWSEQFDLFLQYLGYASSWDDVLIHGDLQTRNFLAYYVKGDQVLAAVGLQHDRQLAALSELIRLNHLPSAEAVRRDPGFDPVARLKALQT
jgi:apoptosis-inducing factor 3